MAGRIFQFLDYVSWFQPILLQGGSCSAESVAVIGSAPLKCAAGVLAQTTVGVTSLAQKNRTARSVLQTLIILDSATTTSESGSPRTLLITCRTSRTKNYLSTNRPKADCQQPIVITNRETGVRLDDLLQPRTHIFIPLALMPIPTVPCLLLNDPPVGLLSFPRAQALRAPPLLHLRILIPGWFLFPQTTPIIHWYASRPGFNPLFEMLISLPLMCRTGLGGGDGTLPSQGVFWC